MRSCEEPTEAGAEGFSRRQFFVRLGGGLAGVTLASLGLEVRPSHAAPPGPIYVRQLLRRISDKGCDPSHGIRVGLPNDHPVISLRDVARRYYACPVDYCFPLGFTGRQEAPAVGLTLTLIGSNFTCGGMAEIRLTSDIPQDSRDFSLPVQPDGTFTTVLSVNCSSQAMAGYVVQATDTATGRRSELLHGQYSCVPPVITPPSPPPSPPPAPVSPSITVSQNSGVFTVMGTGFLPKHDVVVRIVDKQTFQSNFPPGAHTSSDAGGKINFPINGIPCYPSRQLVFTATDGRSNSQDLTGFLWSNPVTLACQ